MRFDSTTYLIVYLKEYLHFNDDIIEYIIQMLDGLTIKLGSIKYYENNASITIDATLQNSNTVISSLTIDKNNGINICLTDKDMVIDFNCNVYTKSKKCSILIDNPDNQHGGIYYYDNGAFNPSKCEYQELYSFYDYEALETIKNLFLPNIMKNDPEINCLNDLIKYTPTNIEHIGFTPDLSLWEEFEEDKKVIKFFLKRDKGNMNKTLRTINYEDIMTQLAGLKSWYKSQSSIEPITYTKK